MYCSKHFDTKGIGRHRQACELAHHMDLQQKVFEKEVAEESKVPPGKLCFTTQYCLNTMICDFIAKQPTLAGSSRSVKKPWEHFGRLGESKLLF
jgi:hypothetical protein